MSVQATTFKLTEEPTGEWTLKGIWVINNFPTQMHRAQSQEFPIRGDMKMYLRFVDPLTRMKSQTTMVVCFTSVPGEYPMDLSARVLHLTKETQAKTSHVVFTPTALRSYIDFPNLCWADLMSSDNYMDPLSNAIRIEFLFHHRLEPYQIPPEVIIGIVPVLPPRCDPPVDDFRGTVGAVGIRNVGGDDCLNSVILALAKLPRFLHLIFGVNTRGMEKAESPIYALQKLLCHLELSSSVADSSELVKKLEWPSDHFVSAVCQEALTSLFDSIEKVFNGRDKEIFKEMIVFKTYRVVHCLDMDYESRQEVVGYNIEVNATDINESFEDLLNNFSMRQIRLEKGNKVHIEGKGVHDAVLRTEVAQIPDVVFVTLQRFTVSDKAGPGLLSKNSVDLQIPKEFNFNRMMKEPIEDDLWDIHAVVVHSGLPENGLFYVNVRFGDEWLEFRSNQVCRVSEKRAINGSDAAMVMYTRRSKRSFLYEPFDVSRIPEHVLSPVERPPPFNVTVITSDDMKCANLRGEVGCGIVGSFEVPAYGDDTFEILRGVIGYRTGTQEEKLSLWSVNNDGLIVSRLLLHDQCRTIEDAPFVYIEEALDGVTDGGCLICMKFYMKREKSPLQCLGCRIVGGDKTISSLFDTVRGIIRVESTVPLVAFRENNDYSASPLNSAMTFEKVGISESATIIFQFPPGYQEASPKLQFANRLPAKNPHKADECPCPENLPETAIVYDVTVDTFPGDLDYFIGDTVDMYYDLLYHCVFLAFQLVCDAGRPPHFYFKVPMGIPIVKLEQLIRQSLGMCGCLEFFMPNEDGTGPSETPVDRTKSASLREEILRCRRVNKTGPITVYISQSK